MTTEPTSSQDVVARLRDRTPIAVQRWSETGRHAVPVDPTPHLRAVLVLLAVALALGAVWFWRAQPREVAALPLPAAAEVLQDLGASPTPQPPSRTADSSLVVHVVGKVRDPGVVSLPQGARVRDAVKAAGGLAKGMDPARINLARQISDGEQIVIDDREPVGSAAGESAGAKAEEPQAAADGGGLVNLNSATAAELDALPGVGPVLAGRIVEWRQQNGRFANVEDLQEVSGIGPKTFADLAPRVRV